LNFLKPSLQVLKIHYTSPQKNLKLILHNQLKKETGSLNQKVTKVVYGVVRKDLILFHIIKSFSKIKTNKISFYNLLLLKIGIYMLLFFQSSPDYAVVDETVRLARDRDKAFINAMLRNISAKREKVNEMIRQIENPELKYSLADLLITDLKKISSNLDKDLEYLNTEPFFHIRSNSGFFTFPEFQNILHEKGIKFRELIKFDSFEIKDSGRILKEFLNQNLFHFQNTGSQIISIIAARFAKHRVLDGCSAPGTKSVTLFQLNPGLEIVANDINKKRIKLLHTHYQNKIPENIRTCVSDITRPALKNSFDLIILDAPCSSSGTLRKNPDLKLKINNRMVKEKSAIQYSMLKAMFDHFSGTHILYSVCSFMEAETETVMEKISEMKKSSPGSPSLQILDLSNLLDEYKFTYKKGKWGYYLLPDETLNNDLFYISLFKI